MARLASRGLHLASLGAKPLLVLFEFLQPLILAVLLICYSYLYSREKMTGGWGGSRRFGLLQHNVCDGSKMYAVRDMNLMSPYTDDGAAGVPQVKVFAPLVFVTDAGGQSSLCFSATGLFNTLALFQSNALDFSVETLGDAFKLQTTGNYTIIYYCSWVVAISSTCLVLQIAFFSDFFDTVSPERGRFLTSEHMLTLTRVHTGLLVLLVALLVSSSSNFSLLKTISNCASMYVGRDDFCTLLTAADLHVAFVLFPSESIVQNYRSIALFLSILVVVSCFAKPRRSHRYGAPQHHRVAAGPPESDQALDRIVLALNQRLGTVTGSQLVRSGNTLLVVPGGVLSGALSREDFLGAQQRVWTRNAMISSWKRLSADAVPSDRCCSICLDPLTTCPDASDVESQHFISELPCGHRFHSSCILEWCVLQSTCPECRKSLS